MNSGRNQHFIPSFLQRAFGIPPRRREIWRFSLDGPPEQRLIKRTGSDYYFYSRPSADGQPTLDDTITNIESDLSQALRDLRSGMLGELIDADKAAAIVSHMLGRTAHFRSAFQIGYARLLERFQTELCQPANVERMLGLDSNAPTKRFRELLNSELALWPELAMLHIPQQEFERAAFAALKENSAAVLGRGRELFSAVVDDLRSRLGELVRDGHNKALGQAVESNAYKDLLGAFEWTLETAPGSGAILPDCIVIAFGEDGRASTPLFVGGEALQAVVMAVSTDRLLVGRKPGFELPGDFKYNVEAAGLSHSYFLASLNDAETSGLHGMIGGAFRAMLDENIKAAFAEAL